MGVFRSKLGAPGASAVLAAVFISMFVLTSAVWAGGSAAEPTSAHERERGTPLGAPRASVAGDGARAASTEGGAWGVRTLLALGSVVAFILVVAAVLRKAAKTQGGLVASLGAGGRAPPGLVEVLGRYPVSRASTLVLLKVDRRVLLVCQSQSRKGGGPAMSTLAEFSDPDEVASILVKARDDEGESRAKQFQSLLTGFGGRGAMAGDDSSAADRGGAGLLRSEATIAPGVASVRGRLASMRCARELTA